MDAKEFKAWFEGFCEGVGDTPTAEQWAKLKQKVGALAGSFDNLNLPHTFRDGIRPGPQGWEITCRDARPFPPQVYAQRGLIGGRKADG